MNPSAHECSAHASSIQDPRELFPSTWFSVEAHYAHGDALGDEAWLHPLERALVARAIPRRRAEFAAGRHCARRALGRLSIAPVALLRDAHGSPLWPAGTLGSISHTEGCAISVAALRSSVRGVGVDVERIDAEAASVISNQVCSASERAALAALPVAARVPHACALFSVKETIYKCVYGATGQRLTFADATVWLDFRQGMFLASLRRPVGIGAERRHRLTGRVGRNERYVFSGQYWLS